MMKSVSDMTPAELRQAAHDAIIRELGVSGLMRYLQDNSLGSGDYTRDRHQWLTRHQSAQELFTDIEVTTDRMRKQGEIK